MRRWLILLFAVLLPLQFTWTAASAYCGHEDGRKAGAATSAPRAEHLGHHAHAHEADAPAAKAPTSPKPGTDLDCVSCHAAAAPAIGVDAARPWLAAAGLGRAADEPPRFRSAPTRAPDRPQWAGLAA